MQDVFDRWNKLQEDMENLLSEVARYDSLEIARKQLDNDRIRLENDKLQIQNDRSAIENALIKKRAVDEIYSTARSQTKTAPVAVVVTPDDLPAHNKSGQPWTQEEKFQLITESFRKIPMAKIALIHGRTQAACSAQLSKIKSDL